jgi:predicted MFS family arabinose efflux permease
VFTAIALQGATKSVEDPSRRTAILDIVGEGRLVNGLSLDVMSNTFGKMIGPIWGGVLLVAVDFSGAYVFIVAVHLLNMWMVTQLKIPRHSSNQQTESVWRALGVAIGFTRHSPNLLGLLYVTLVMNALGFPVQQFIPAIGRDFLGVGPVLVGLLTAADGFGQLTGAGFMTMTRNVRYHGRVLVLGSMAVLTTFFLFVWSPWYALTFIVLAMGGLGQSGFSTMQTAIALLAAPQEIRGRMMGLLSFCIGVGTPLGGFEMSLATTVFSVQTAISANVFVGLLLMLPTIAYTRLLWRPLTRLSPAAVEG